MKSFQKDPDRPFPPMCVCVSSACELCPGAPVLANLLHGLLCLRVGQLPLLLTPDRRRHRHRRPGLDIYPHGPRGTQGGHGHARGTRESGARGSRL